MAGDNTKGFTLPELLIATAIFAVVVLVALTSFLTIGRLFYKGVTITQSQDALRSIMSDVTNGIQRAKNGEVTITASCGVNCTYYCISGTRYTALLGPVTGTQTNRPMTPAGFSLLKDTPSSCPAPFPFTAAGSIYQLNEATELLGNGVWLRQFGIANPSTDFYNVVLAIAYGERSNFFPDPPSTAYPSFLCKGGSTIGTAFCSTNQTSTSVIRGINKYY
ncbi:MAG TPA: prepilin-type N-terminal cleavage/methylation domain-containing protein [Candidatus Saccharimonadales bacterium]|nr:prepilin-type N-terminal cleavage/methylation domain-containing protein [Candidatus Saccharimonadales bacterium]